MILYPSIWGSLRQPLIIGSIQPACWGTPSGEIYELRVERENTLVIIISWSDLESDSPPFGLIYYLFRDCCPQRSHIERMKWSKLNPAPESEKQVGNSSEMIRCGCMVFPSKQKGLLMKSSPKRRMIISMYGCQLHQTRKSMDTGKTPAIIKVVFLLCAWAQR